MAKYGITGVWKNANGVITHYAMHIIDDNTLGRLVKKSKADAVAITENGNNEVITLLWNYRTVSWNIGEDVIVVDDNGKFLRSTPDDTVRDNLEHLINYGLLP